MKKTSLVKSTVPRLLFYLSFLVYVMVGCSKNPNANLTPTGLSADAVNNAAALTAESRRIQTGSMTPASPPIPTFDATSIAVTGAIATQLIQVTPSLTLTVTIMPTSLVITPTLTPALPVGQDNSVFTGKETIPDGTKFTPGIKFSKSWQFMNNGQTTWTTAYSLVFVSGAQMGGPESVPLKIEVLAGRIVDITLDLSAPETPGAYKGNWRLRNSNGQFFGDLVYVQIEVVE